MFDPFQIPNIYIGVAIIFILANFLQDIRVNTSTQLFTQMGSTLAVIDCLYYNAGLCLSLDKTREETLEAIIPTHVCTQFQIYVVFSVNVITVAKCSLLKEYIISKEPERQLVFLPICIVHLNPSPEVKKPKIETEK